MKQDQNLYHMIEESLKLKRTNHKILQSAYKIQKCLRPKDMKRRLIMYLQPNIKIIKNTNL
jgi:hypothetical protein